MMKTDNPLRGFFFIFSRFSLISQQNLIFSTAPTPEAWLTLMATCTLNDSTLRLISQFDIDFLLICVVVFGLRIGSFPCPSCGDPEGQVKRAVAALRSAGATIGMLWLDIEGTQYWRDQAYNRNFFDGLLRGCAAAGVKIGIYTSASQWNPIMGASSAGSHYPLWYAHCTYIELVSLNLAVHFSCAFPTLWQHN